MNRTLAMMLAIGWQGGTVHQLAVETGISVTDIIYGKPESTEFASPYNLGWMLAQVSSTIPLSDYMRKKYHGNKDFWLGIAEGMSLRKT